MEGVKVEDRPTVRAIGPAEPWFCNCQDFGYRADGSRHYSNVLRTPTVSKCAVCGMVAPWAEEVSA
jgi:hypothetical protein